MKPTEKLELAETIMKMVVECVYCEACKLLAAEYFCAASFSEQLEKESTADCRQNTSKVTGPGNN